MEELAANTVSRFKIDCAFASLRPPVTVDNEVALHLYYIVQEATLNAVRHGKAAKVKISLEPEKSVFKLTVQDDGVGFESVNANRTGMGIRIMRYRAKVIGATLDLQSQPGRGTLITCVFNPSVREERAKNNS